MINQEFNNITQSGTTQEINAVAESLGFSEAQGFFIIGGFFLTLFFVLFIVYSLIKTYISKSCSTCKPLKRLEKEIQELKKANSLKGFFDKQNQIKNR